jgi:hypothetical protein
MCFKYKKHENIKKWMLLLQVWLEDCESGGSVEDALRAIAAGQRRRVTENLCQFL